MLTMSVLFRMNINYMLNVLLGLGGGVRVPAEAPGRSPRTV